MQKIRMLFALFITLPLILSQSLEPGYAKPNKFHNVMGDILDKLDVFNSKTDEEKDKILKELDSSISDLNVEIKKYIAEKNEIPNVDIIDLMKQILEINHYLLNRVCAQEDHKCVNEKKRLMNNILAVVEDNFGKCEVTIDRMTKLTKDTNMNFVVLNLLIQALIDNKDFIERNKLDIIVNIINCLNDKFNEYFPIIEEQYGHKAAVVTFLKKSLTEALRRSLLKLTGSDGKEGEKKLSIETREDVYGEILDMLKEIKDSNQNKTLVVIISCLTTVIILVGGFLLYRFIRRKNNSNPIENTKDIVAA